MIKHLTSGRLRRLMALGAVGALLAACVTDSELGNKSREITEEESMLVFSAPGLRNGFRRIIEGYADSHYTRQITAHYGPRTGKFPYASIARHKLTRFNYYFKGQELSKAIGIWTNFKDNPPKVGETTWIVNSIGRVQYALFDHDDASCVYFEQYFGPQASYLQGNHRITGYYCDSAERPLTDKRAREVVAGIGDRKFGMPQTVGVPAELTLSWAKADKIENIPLSVNIDDKHPKGKFAFTSTKFGQCSGDWQITKRPTDASLGKGSWTTSCESNAANGTFIVNTALNGSGSGSDKDEQLVLFTFYAQ